MNLTAIIGTNRNLTSFISAIMSLHPNCQVLNHGIKVFRQNNFIEDPDKLETFLASARKVSSSKRSLVSVDGGSILESAAMKNYPKVQNAYKARYGDAYSKDDVNNVLWKDGKAFTEYLMGLESLEFEANEVFHVNLLLPIRNPLDCTMSQYRKNKLSYVKTLDQILDRFKFCLKLHDQHPDKVFILREIDFTVRRFRALAQFMGLPDDEKWESDIADCLVVNDKRYACPHALAKHFVSRIDEFEPWPDVYEMFSKIVGLGHSFSVKSPLSIQHK